jgi:hypothetical protein
MKNLKNEVLTTPKGKAIFPWLTNADIQFDSDGKLLQKRDLYTKEPMMDFAYDAEDTQRKEEYEYDKEHRITNITKPSSKTIDSVYSEERLSSISTQEGTTAYLYACQNNLSTISKENESLSFA